MTLFYKILMYNDLSYYQNAQSNQNGNQSIVPKYGKSILKVQKP